MPVRVRPFIVAALVLAACSAGFAQSPRVVRWQKGAAGSDEFTLDGVVVKRLRTNGVTVRASVVDGVVVRVTIDNDGATPVEIRPERLALEVTAPASRDLARLSVREAADRALAAENGRASIVELNGSSATKTVTETHTVWSDSVSAPLSDRTGVGETPHTVVITETKTVPDDSARWDATTQARNIRTQAELDRQRAVAAALAPTTLAPTYSTSGVVYFRNASNAKEVLLRVPVGDVVVEIPYTVTRRRVLLWRKVNVFE